MSKILVFAGKKQSGKSTAVNFVVGYAITQLARNNIPYLPHRFTIDEEDGSLIVNAPPWGIETVATEGEGVLDLNNRDPEYITWASDCMWPHVKTYAHADMLKAIAVNAFGIPTEWVHGTDEDKRQTTKIKWKDICTVLPPKIVGNIKKAEKYDSKMTVREFLQYFGTNVCRKIYNDVWVDSCYNRIEAEQPDLAIVSDARFRNEIMAAKKHKARIVKLERSPYKDLHDSEVDLDKMNNSHFDLVVPADVTLKEMNQLILEAMYEWGWFDTHKDLEINNG